MKRPEEHILQSLLEKHALGITTPEERAVLEEWYAAFPEKGAVWQDAGEKAAVKSALKAGIFDVITEEKGTGAAEVTELRVVKPPRSIYWQAAAAVLVLLATGLFFLARTGTERPGGYAEVTAPAGKGVMKVQLPDQSVMWLEPGSKVRYRQDFGNAGREVELTDGMVYFSVLTETEHPFIVSTTPGIQVRVLGTAFTVKAYSGLRDVQIAVESGAVQVSDSSDKVLGILKAGEQIVYETETHNTRKTAGPREDWRNGNLLLNNVSFAEVARILENRYGLEVEYDETIMAPYRFNLHAGRQATAEEVLEMLKDISGLEYTIVNGKVIIKGQ
ncbi:FecR family protein [Chitinophaga barathri]|uniref:FecR family protein n=1 Tax=Chitinophaga barathri TaxID=1647451 RepID=A0A3N4MEF1_9BACT|nr:FecR family protein [Chitinophaga barathri]RPD39997.1 FecR family protein [Chitinophaga barathri]